MQLTKAKVITKTQLTHDIFQLDFETDSAFNFQAGQFVTIKINDKIPPCFRAYSIASAPKKDGKTFFLIIKVIEGGRGSNWLNSLIVGNEIEFLGPNGKFIFQSGNEKEILFVATGTGIAPFISMVNDEISKGNKQKMKIIFGLRHIKDIFFENWLKETAEQHKNFTYEITLSQPEDKEWKGNKGRVTNIIENLKIDANNTEIYVCGLRAMIDSVTQMLKEKEINEEAIHMEKYD